MVQRRIAVIILRTHIRPRYQQHRNNDDMPPTGGIVQRRVAAIIFHIHTRPRRYQRSGDCRVTTVGRVVQRRATTAILTPVVWTYGVTGVADRIIVTLIHIFSVCVAEQVNNNRQIAENSGGAVQGVYPMP